MLEYRPTYLKPEAWRSNQKKKKKIISKSTCSLCSSIPLNFRVKANSSQYSPSPREIFISSPSDASPFCRDLTTTANHSCSVEWSFPVPNSSQGKKKYPPTALPHGALSSPVTSYKPGM